MKYAIVGTGARHQMFRGAISKDFAESSELVGLCDINEKRLEASAAKLGNMGGNGVATYAAAEFDQMIAAQAPDAVVVTVPDYLHHEYIVRALRAGCDVITEKPMTTDLVRLKAILDAQKETGKSVTVTFNYRYTPARTQIKDILQSGAIGDLVAVDFRWHLDRVHGADYFRRWHRYKEKSGGLLVHKSTHHFDLLNWWVGSTPKTVSATGRRVFYTPEMADSFGLQSHGARCLDCPVAEKCDFQMDLKSDAGLSELYLDAESSDGYIRDKCVFAPDIDIEDMMQVQAQYNNQVQLNYSLCAFSPWEGMEVKFYGTKGELNHRHVEVHGVFGGKRDRGHADAMTTVLHVAGQPIENMDVWQGEGDHGGADPVMLGYLFDPQNSAPDQYNRGSTHVDGAWSILTGIAANESIKVGETIDVDEMLTAQAIQLQR